VEGCSSPLLGCSVIKEVDPHGSRRESAARGEDPPSQQVDGEGERPIVRTRVTGHQRHPWPRHPVGSFAYARHFPDGPAWAQCLIRGGSIVPGKLRRRPLAGRRSTLTMSRTAQALGPATQDRLFASSPRRSQTRTSVELLVPLLTPWIDENPRGSDGLKRCGPRRQAMRRQRVFQM